MLTSLAPRRENQTRATPVSASTSKGSTARPLTTNTRTLGRVVLPSCTTKLWDEAWASLAAGQSAGLALQIRSLTPLMQRFLTPSGVLSLLDKRRASSACLPDVASTSRNQGSRDPGRVQATNADVGKNPHLSPRFESFTGLAGSIGTALWFDKVGRRRTGSSLDLTASATAVSAWGRW